MTEEDYIYKAYSLTIEQYPDRLTLIKTGGTSWSKIKLSIHDESDVIDLRGKSMAEGLYFLLGDLLGKNNE